MRKTFYCKHRRLFSLETAWRSIKEFRFGIEVESGYGRDFLTTISMSFGIFTVWFSFQMLFARIKEDDYDSYEWGISLYRFSGETTFTWDWRNNANSWTSGTPWWRHTYLVVADVLFGKWKCQEKDLSGQNEVWTDPLDGKQWPCSITVTRYDRHRARLKFLHNHFHRIELSLDPEQKGIGAPIPGKGENSWDCDDSTTSCISFGLGNDPLPNDHIEWAKQHFTDSVQNTRLKHGGKNWKPSEAVA